MPKNPQRSFEAKGTKTTAVSRSTSSAGRQNPVPSDDAGNPTSDSIASLSLATLLEAVSKRARVEMARAMPTIESAVVVVVKG